MTTSKSGEQPRALTVAEDFADWQAAKGKDHPATQEAHEKLSDLLRRQEALLRQALEALSDIREATAQSPKVFRFESLVAKLKDRLL